MVLPKTYCEKRAAVVPRLRHGLLYAAVYTKEKENENPTIHLVSY